MTASLLLWGAHCYFQLSFHPLLHLLHLLFPLHPLHPLHLLFPLFPLLSRV